MLLKAVCECRGGECRFFNVQSGQSCCLREGFLSNGGREGGTEGGRNPAPRRVERAAGCVTTRMGGGFSPGAGARVVLLLVSLSLSLSPHILKHRSSRRAERRLARPPLLLRHDRHAPLPLLVLALLVDVPLVAAAPGEVEVALPVLYRVVRFFVLSWLWVCVGGEGMQRRATAAAMARRALRPADLSPLSPRPLSSARHHPPSHAIITIQPLTASTPLTCSR